MTRFIVESVHRIPSRPWIFVTGRLESGDMRFGDEMTVTYGDAHVASAVVRSIELPASCTSSRTTPAMS